ncbi:MAG: hypothetical protein GX221_03175 [Candidatus Riflebacteria bacterium]|nr:hypothetical protein [Candidatus Riflebacteria bacterium]
MKFSKGIVTALLLLALSPVYANEAYDMGKIEVAGKDERSKNFSAIIQKPEMNISDKISAVPTLMPEIKHNEYKPITEAKPFEKFDNRHLTKEFKIYAGAGSEGSKELGIDAKASYDGYAGYIKAATEQRDGYKTPVDYSMDQFSLYFNNKDQNRDISYSGGMEFSSDENGFLANKAMAERFGWMSNDNFKLSLKGDSTLDDGTFVAFYTGFAHNERDVRAKLSAFQDKQKNKTFGIGASFLRQLNETFKIKGALDLKKNDFSSSLHRSYDFTKTSFGTALEFTSKNLGSLEAGLKTQKLGGTSHTSPFLKYNYKFKNPLNLTIGYEEDLGNDDTEKVFMPSAYTASTAHEASKLKTLRGTLAYSFQNSDRLALELFSQTEKNALQRTDNLTGDVLAYNLSYIDAERKGITLKGDFSIENDFSIKIAGTLQNPKNEANGNRISYEPKKILDVAFAYEADRLKIIFSRKAEMDREAITSFGTFEADDFSRSDVTFSYQINKTFGTYIKVLDLYNESSNYRHNVEEAERVTILGLEASF